MKKKVSTIEGKVQKRGRTTSKNLEKRFDNGQNVLDYFDVKNVVRRINLDLPEWAIKNLDKEAERRGIPRQSLIKTWIVDKLDSIKGKKPA